MVRVLIESGGHRLLLNIFWAVLEIEHRVRLHHHHILFLLLGAHLIWGQSHRRVPSQSHFHILNLVLLRHSREQLRLRLLGHQRSMLELRL